jgi:hypothetical protein
MDGLILVDLTRVEPAVPGRFMGKEEAEKNLWLEDVRHEGYFRSVMPKTLGTR